MQTTIKRKGITMRKCIQCGCEIIDSEVIFCPECGTRLESIGNWICDCGAFNTEAAKFCIKCGKNRIDAETSANTIIGKIKHYIKSPYSKINLYFIIAYLISYPILLTFIESNIKNTSQIIFNQIAFLSGSALIPFIFICMAMNGLHKVTLLKRTYKLPAFVIIYYFFLLLNTFFKFNNITINNYFNQHSLWLYIICILIFIIGRIYSYIAANK